MKESVSSPEPKKGLSVDECLKKADKYIQNNNQCLFLFDVKGSKKYESDQRDELQKRLFILINDLNIKFDEYFPENCLATPTRKEKGFFSLLGDGSWVGINNSEVIPKIIDVLNKDYSDISFNFGVAKDGFDQEGLKIIK